MGPASDNQQTTEEDKYKCVSVHLEGVGDRQPHDAWTQALSGYDGEQGSKGHDAVSHKLQTNSQPPAHTQPLAR